MIQHVRYGLPKLLTKREVLIAREFLVANDQHSMCVQGVADVADEFIRGALAQVYPMDFGAHRAAQRYYFKRFSHRASPP